MLLIAADAEFAADAPADIEILQERYVIELPTDMIPETPNIACACLPLLADIVVVFLFVIYFPSQNIVQRGLNDNDSSPSRTKIAWCLGTDVSPSQTAIE